MRVARLNEVGVTAILDLAWKDGVIKKFKRSASILNTNTFTVVLAKNKRGTKTVKLSHLLKEGRGRDFIKSMGNFSVDLKNALK